MKKLASPIVPMVCSVLLSACATHPLPNSPTHIMEAPRPAGSIPEPVQQSAALPPPAAAPKVETYSVTVHKVPVQSLLFALARDAGLNVDVHPGIEGTVTLNALDQTLPQLLNRIQRQVDMRYEINGGTLTVLPDTPEWRNYKVDYVNIARSTNSSVNIATQISTTGGGSGSASNPVVGTPATGQPQQPQQQQQSAPANNGANGNGSNNSTTVVNNRSDNNFWYSLEKNIRDMLRASNLGDNPVDPLASMNGATPGATAQTPFDASGFGGAKSGANAQRGTSVIVNAEGGLIAVRATARQHEKIREFLDIVLGAAKRQVLIEATIIEVRLGDQYQQGINWQSLARGGLKLNQGALGSATLPTATNPGVFVMNYTNPTSRLGNIAATIELLESFGKVKVLSSPKISVLNNQTALLKVVDNNVFFSIKVTPAVLGSTGTPISQATYESHLETVPVGFVMSVTPQISESDEVTLNVRPTITRVVGYVNDPNPDLAKANVISKVPVIQARELESLMKVSSGQIAVMGGLMQDSIDNAKDGIPGLSSVPLIGDLFSHRNENTTKTELVIFMRPVVVKDASVNGDYKDYRYLLPSEKPDSAPYGAATPAPAPAKANGS
ncbi:pilus (MSHA type) biogenesis protein MshL [Duganella sp. BJB488]|uniref:pilus (MSHA type) biogenesis protein MshL n=1 Tax=unclassified Duganella TaxID=2636909 RepID=UPI000E34BF34|nr:MULTISPECIES: pilus (MSHA type) biogenesis protein MshL [unclassified Duganella]RFP21685.1 pilus (MSHA type) biogenesis protein MshL [Duganella sp. BJB489]RFP23478.1 pilus (MSHA type) biogenesis protein MshL [Duganella sp. BJB488]RFP38644.1 pilus (MSHA type) biogenesis protein MshL [Duganella sp. BJB480]